MRSSFDQIVRYLSCPDDKAPLDARADALVCTGCGRPYPLLGGKIANLLPQKPAIAPANREYALQYERQFHRAFESRNEAMLWGTRESSPPSWILKRERQRRAVLSMLQETRQPLDQLVLCDISAGPGHYTLAYSRYFKWVFHCDLSVTSLKYALRRTLRMGITNVFFLRVDYFALPFCCSLDRILCLDTLLRGEDHERALLGQIQDALTAEGKALVDFHHWWHNPLRRLGLLPQNLGRNRSYTRRQTERLLRESGIDEWRLVRFYQEFERTNPPRILSSVLPATRLMYEFGRSAAESAHDRTRGVPLAAIGPGEGK